MTDGNEEELTLDTVSLRPRGTFALHGANIRRVLEPSVPHGTLLVVDDEAMLRSLLTHMLFGAGFSVLEAGNGEQALQRVRESDGKVDLVITDLDMPVMGGHEFARIFRPAHPLVPILFITGHGARADLARSLEASGELLRKPFRPDLLVETVERMLARRPYLKAVPRLLARS
jgi:CheY-like chemotaxis protein